MSSLTSIERARVKLLCCEIAGTYYRSEQERSCAAELQVGNQLLLEREPTNEYDKYAVKVIDKATGLCVGYIPKTLGVCVSNLLETALESRLTFHTEVVGVKIRDRVVVVAVRIDLIVAVLK